MAFHSGNGGEIVVDGTTLHITRWTRDSDGGLANVTNSGSAGSTQYVGTVVDHSWSVDIPWDDTNIPNVDVNLREGAIVNIVFHYGASGKTETLTGTTVERVNVVNDNSPGDIIRSTVSGKGGVLTRPTT